jgi:hypothetical protein
MRVSILPLIALMLMIPTISLSDERDPSTFWDNVDKASQTVMEADTICGTSEAMLVSLTYILTRATLEPDPSLLNPMAPNERILERMSRARSALKKLLDVKCPARN